MNVLYISYDGLTDPLGKSQVLPYIIGLSRKGYPMSVISYEKCNNYRKFKEDISLQLGSEDIQWKPLRYYTGFSFISSFLNILKGLRVARGIINNSKIDIVHCRSYISAFKGMLLKKRYKTHLIFDMRGFWADERREAGLLKLKPLYLFMKNLERKILLASDSIISLTEAGIYEMKSWEYMNENQISKCTQIATCCDIQKYRQAYEINKVREIDNKNYKFVYVGSIGPWHSLEILCSFMKFTYHYLPNSTFRLVVNQGEEHVRSFITNELLDEARFIVENISHDEVPKALENFDIGFFFIPPNYAKTASSPTKMGEMLAAGLPIITGHSIGDVDRIVRTNNIGYTMNSFNDKNYKNALDHVTSLIISDRGSVTERCLQVAQLHYSLDKAVDKYAEIYTHLIK